MRLFKNAGLNISDTFLEVILESCEIYKFATGSSMQKRHDICIECIKKYADTINKTTQFFRDNVINE